MDVDKTLDDVVSLTVCGGRDVLLTGGGRDVLLTGGGSLCAKILPIIHKKTMEKNNIAKNGFGF